MMKRRHLFLPALGALTILSGSLLVAGIRQQPATGARGAEPTAAPRGPAASLAHPTSPTKAADAAGFLQRWLLLEPIKVSGQLTDSAVRATIQKEYFPGQLSAVPHDGDTVTVAGAGDSLTWHAVDTLGYNVNLYHFAYALNKPTSNVLFWAVTIVNAPRDMAGVRLAIGSNAASIWWLNGEELIGIFNDRQAVVDDGVSKRVTLKKGSNVIRAAIINAGGATDFCARFLDEEGHPVKGLTLSLAASGQLR